MTEIVPEWERENTFLVFDIDGTGKYHSESGYTFDMFWTYDCITDELVFIFTPETLNPNTHPFIIVQVSHNIEIIDNDSLILHLFLETELPTITEQIWSLKRVE